MSKFNFIIAVLFVVVWVIGFFTQVVNFAVHIVLLTALLLILLSIFIESKKTYRRSNKRGTSDLTGTLLFLLSVILIICWAIGFFIYAAGMLIHILLAIAIIAIILKLLNEKEMQ